MGTIAEIGRLAPLISLASLAWILNDWLDGLFNSQADFCYTFLLVQYRRALTVSYIRVLYLFFELSE